MLNKLFRKRQNSHLINLSSGLRIILTARTLEAINEAASKSYTPLVKPVTPSPEIRSKYSILQNPTTGKIEVINDYRAKSLDNQMVTIIDFTHYYPHNFPSPFAAYLVPKDIVVGEEVLLDDLIQDIVGGGWNQGDRYRLKSCNATWDGKDFILHIPKEGPSDYDRLTPTCFATHSVGEGSARIGIILP